MDKMQNWSLSLLFLSNLQFLKSVYGWASRHRSVNWTQNKKFFRPLSDWLFKVLKNVLLPHKFCSPRWLACTRLRLVSLVFRRESIRTAVVDSKLFCIGLETQKLFWRLPKSLGCFSFTLLILPLCFQFFAKKWLQ